MNNSMRKVVLGAMFFGVTCIVAVAGYMAAGWQLLDAIFMVVITVFGVGYGETRPLESAGLRIFTIGVIIAGCSSGIYVVGGFVQMLAEGEINRVLGNRRMSKGIDSLLNHTLICGFGRVGQMLAADLAAAKHPFVVIDSSDSRVAEAQAAGFLAVLGNASDEPALLNAGIARAESPSTEKKLRRSGANRIVLPALIGAAKIATMITCPSAEDLLMATEGTAQLRDDLKLIGLEMTELGIESNSPLVGKSVGDVEQGAGGFVIVAVKRPDGSLVRAPQADLTLSAGDRFIILGHNAVLPELVRKAKPRPTMTYRGMTV